MLVHLVNEKNKIKTTTMKTGWKGKTISIFSVLSVALLLSCNKPDLNKLSGVQWDPNAAAPIGYADFGVYDILAAKDSNDIVIINPLDGEIALAYNGQIVSISAQEVVQLNDVSQQFNLAPTDLGLATTGSFNGTINSSNSENIDVTIPNGVELHTVDFESGSLDINVSTTLQHDITLDITFTDLESNSTPIVRTINLAYGGSVPQTGNASVNLANVIGDFTAGGSTVNRLRIDVDATISGTGQPIVGTETLDLTMNLSNMEFDNVYGYFGQQTLASASDSILVKIFNSASEGVFSFTNPSVKFVIDNSFGIPITMDFTNIETINTVTNQVVPLTGYPSTLVINTPASIGQSATTSLTLNNTNTTNIATVVTQTPKYLSYDVTATSNPAGQVGPLNFVESTSKFVVNAELSLPLEGYAYDFTASDTLPFSFDANVDNIETVMFRINATNGFPVSFVANAVFVDENYVPLFTLSNTPEQVVTAAPVNSSGRVTSSINKITDFTITKAKTQLLNQVKHVIITGTAETTTPQTTVVKFYDNYRILLKLGMQVQMKTTL